MPHLTQKGEWRDDRTRDPSIMLLDFDDVLLSLLVAVAPTHPPRSISITLGNYDYFELSFGYLS